MKTSGPFKQDRLRLYSIKYGASNPGLLNKLKLCLTDQALHSVAVYRLGSSSTVLLNRNRLIGFPPLVLYKFLNYFIKTIHHVTILRQADIGPGFYIMHPHSIMIGNAIIGSYCTIHHNLTIGQAVAGLDHSIPQIGDNVWIGPQCVITGNIKIGNGVTISAGTILSRDVPDNCLVAGNPGRVIMQNYDNKTMSIKQIDTP